MDIQNTIDLDRLHEIVTDPLEATDEQLRCAAALIPGTSLQFGQRSPGFNHLSFGDIMLISDVLHQVVARGLTFPPPLTLEA